MASSIESDGVSPTVAINHLSFTHQNGTKALVDVVLDVKAGSRVLIIGSNGAGKSTLLQICAGKRMVPASSVSLLSQDVFRKTPPGVTFLGTEWAMNPHVRGDILVSAFLDSVGGYRHKTRRDMLLEILDVDLNWRMHQISDGERRRVQLVMGLMAPWQILLLDEVTVDLDVLVRHDLMTFLKQETEERGSTILYATHIFDGLEEFPTHVAHMRDGTFLQQPVPWPVAPGMATHASLYNLALDWLKEDRDVRIQEEKSGQRTKRGARRDEVPTDSETFYKKYDYSH
ncbi:CCR4-NOT regulatory complex component [Serendipita sp. 411]|nr:CCR4-NOT regulatory complex component [Serendipita sp. 401]KAG8845247.1 CCR4-NOT regulatory complex component [Serendipita sp. 411]KAG9020159.1 CCR4-NOT regulatory complex component [Serendipita sp. 407]